MSCPIKMQNRFLHLTVVNYFVLQNLTEQRTDKLQDLHFLNRIVLRIIFKTNYLFGFVFKAIINK